MFCRGTETVGTRNLKVWYPYRLSSVWQSDYLIELLVCLIASNVARFLVALCFVPSKLLTCGECLLP